ncbi:MAG: hypothetical protein ABIC95_02270 [archaeon]
MFPPVVLLDGVRYMLHRFKVGLVGYQRYQGNAEEILRQIIEACYDRKKRYFRTSTGHYNEFWTRDFGICAPHLINLGYRDEVRDTLRYALSIFREYDHVSTTINPWGTPFDFPAYAPDSLAHLMRSLALVDDEKLIAQHRGFLEKKAKEYCKKVIDKKTGLVKKNIHFSSMKDYAIRSSSCYNNCMTAMLSHSLSVLRIPNPFIKHDYTRLIRKHFWKKDHFIDDLSGNKSLTGDAQVFPFYCEVFFEKRMLDSCVVSMRKRRLDKPFPLRYFHKRIKEHDMLSIDWLVGGWEHDNVWPMLAMPFFAVLDAFCHPDLGGHIEKYKKLVEKHGTLLEVFTQDGKPLRTPLYCADEGMLWSAVLLDIMQKRKNE